jgi:hypothetical protein
MDSFTGNNGTQFNHNSDFSGYIFITDRKGNEIKIPAGDILQLVAEAYILPKRISKLEDLTYEDLLK